MIQPGKEESADFEATRASLYLHLNTTIKLKQRPPNSFCNIQSAVGRRNVIKTSADADFDETEFRDERVSSFILSYHDDKLDMHGNPITHAKEEATEDATDKELDTPSPSSAMDDRKSESPHLKQTPALSPSVSTQATTPPAPTTLGTFPRLASRPVSQRALAISSPSLPRGQSSLARSSSFTLQDTHIPFSDSVQSEAEEGQATDLTTQLQDEEDDENFDAMDEYRQFSLQKSFGWRGSEWGGASSGGRGGRLTNLFACFTLSIPPHADAQKTNDMAFPPSTRLKMHKAEVDLVSAVQYVCMITDLLLKDDIVTFDDTTQSGQSRRTPKLSTSSPAASSPRDKVGEMYQTCMVESGLVHFTLSALRFGVTAEHCAFLTYFVVVENAWAPAVTKAECLYVDPDEAITLSFGSPKTPSSDPLIHLSPLPFPSTYVPPLPQLCSSPEPYSPPENEEWESDTLLPSPPQLILTLTQFRSSYTHSLSSFCLSL
ncbi:hypothetical protein BLNAU_5538 [Blattamonas nauphoetae]|uniref:Uncharacterized protein n=1 Tax=Blattamonas nauphoetae TaxID=2049346 RepID=A0ABQ9Y738_9EUKA|nr:hypothetical protein BLNAU_5538 [Blattamonas nauphoetae]